MDDCVVPFAAPVVGCERYGGEFGVGDGDAFVGIPVRVVGALHGESGVVVSDW